MLKRRWNHLRYFLIVCGFAACANVAQAQLLIDFNVDITQDDSGLYTYEYTIDNSAFSAQALNTLFLTTGDRAEVIDIFGPNDGWIALYDPDVTPPNLQASFTAGISDDGLECGVTDEFDLAPGESAVFTITSTWAPEVISDSYVIGTLVEGCEFGGDLIFGEIEVPAIPVFNPSDPCDFDGDGDCDVVDIDNLAFTILEGSNDPTFDLSSDNAVNMADLDLFLSQVGSLNGDLDLNGTVAFSDFLNLSANFGLEAEWSGGDLDIDGTVGFADFLMLSENFGQSGGAGALASVPEPATGCMALLFFVCGSLLRRRRN